MWSIKRGGAEEREGLLPGPPDPSETEAFAELLPHPAQEYRRGMFIYFVTRLPVAPSLSRACCHIPALHKRTLVININFALGTGTIV